MVRGAGAGAVLVLLSGALSAQQPPAPQPGLRQGSGGQAAQTFKSGTEVVQVDVRVFDKDGRFVTDLKPEDFEIKEDGVPQPIVNLTLVGGSTAPRTAPGTSTSTRGTSTPAPGTLAPGTPTWVFLFDTLHLSPGGLDRARKAVEAFVSTRLPEGAVAGVIANGRMANNRLTSNREELVKAVHDIKVPETAFTYQMQMTREWPRFQDEFEAWMIAVHNDSDTLQRVVARACSEEPDQCRGTPPDLAVRDKAKQIEQAAEASAKLSLEVVRGLSNGLARMPGPKTIVFLSEGFVLQEMESELRDATGLANRGGAHFYTIDVRGLNKGAGASIIDQPLAADPFGAPASFDLQADGTNALAVDTGGMAIRNENNIGRALDLVAQDSGTYYVVGYTPSNQTFDGKYRAISVTVKRPDVKVRARRGYLALPPTLLLKPTPIERPSPTATPAPVPGPDSPAAEPANAVVAHSAGPSAPAPNAIRTRIENGGLVVGLPGEDATMAGDPASRGWAAYQKGDVETAERELKAASAEAGVSPWVHYVLGFCELALQRFPDAAAAWERVRTVAPAFEPVYFNLADAYVGESARDRAKRVLDDAAKRWPKDAEIFDAEGVIQIHSGALVDAIASFERATKLAPTDPLGFFNLASAHHAAALRLRELARQTASQQQLASPDDRRLLGSSGGSGLLGKALWQRNAAIQNYRRVIALNGDYVDQAKKGIEALGGKQDG
jgi:VWFA-related protein